MKEAKRETVEISVTEQALSAHHITSEALSNVVRYLHKVFGRKYFRLFPRKIQNEHLGQLFYVANSLASIDTLKGFERHINEYSKNNMDDHLFTAKTAEWLAAKGFDVELEPFNSDNETRPDICCIDSSGKHLYLECKRIRKEKFFDLEEKERIANLVYEKVRTCDQITIYLKNKSASESLERRLDDAAFVSCIHKSGVEHSDASIDIDGEFRVNVMRRPPIIGPENDFLTVTLEVVMEDVTDGEKLPGYAFLRGGRSVGVFGPPPDYSSIWNRKRSKSKKQNIHGKPFIVIICGEDVLGKPQDHKSFFDRVWLTNANAEFSGIGILSMATNDGNPQLQYFKNPHAQHPIPDIFLEAIINSE